MTTELQSSITQLYGVFARYPLNRNMKACTCCVDANARDSLLGTDLHALSQEQIRHFAFKAATTWGTTNDYRHFLPRIFEIMATECVTDIALEPWFQASRLKFTKWLDWPREEQQAVLSFWKAWFAEVLATPPSSGNAEVPHAEDLVEAAATLGLNVAPMLESWAAGGASAAAHLALAVLNLDSYGRAIGSWNADEAARNLFEKWLRDPERELQLIEAASDTPIVEEAFQYLRQLPPLKNSPA